jgi:hypothetical protein
VLVEELSAAPGFDPVAFEALAWPGDKALWAFFEFHDAFAQASLFARAEALRGGQYANRWNSLPQQEIVVTEEKRTAFAAEVREFYRQSELRGEHCHVNHSRRPGNTDYFFVYLPDWPDRRPGFDSDGTFIAKDAAYAFDNVFVFDPNDGSVEVIARGGKKVQLPLRRAFCKAILGIDVDDDEPIRPAYRLDQLLDPNFEFTSEPEADILDVQLRRIRFIPRSNNTHSRATEYLEIKFKEGASRQEIRDEIDGYLTGNHLTRNQVAVVQASVQIRFLPHLP